MQERQLDRIGDLFDLAVETAHVVVGDVRNFFEHEVVGFGARELFEQHARAWIHEGGVAAAEAFSQERVGQLDYAFFVGATGDEGAPPIGEHLFDGDDLTGGVGAACEHDGQRFVEHDLLPAREPAAEVGVHRHAHLATACEDVDGVVVVGSEHRAVTGGGLREFVDLFAQRGDVLARLAQGVGELLVLGDGLGQLAFRFEQPFLERTHALWCVGVPLAQRQ
ncbi:unannotated protein [freshwater metagenome]|uniref:Unannotated protein n=1 Tax=freshwater metagenome TaxID=449393 RepID=A0A6J7APH0_9ZZZZ